MPARCPRRWPIQIATTLAAWLVAFAVVTALLTIFGNQLKTLPIALRALVISGALVALMVNLVMPALTRVIGRWTVNARTSGTPLSATRLAVEHQQLETLPAWPSRTIAVLGTLAHGPYAIPVSAPQRAGDRRILLSLRRDRRSLARLRQVPDVALTLLAEGDIAFTARGRASVVEERMSASPDYAAVAINVEQIDDHRQAAFVVESGVDRQWRDVAEQRALRERVRALARLAGAGGRVTPAQASSNRVPAPPR